MRVGFLYVDALAGGGYPRDVRWLAGHLAELGVSVSLLADHGPRIDALDGVEVAPPESLGSLGSTLDVLHIWGIFLPRQFWLARRLIGKARPVVSPMGHLIRSHIRRRAWKKVPYLLAMRPLFSRWRTVAHLFSSAEVEGARRYLHPVAEFEATLGVFPPPPDVARTPGHRGDYVLFLGRNDVYQKGLDLLLLSYAEAAERGLKLPLRIAGQPSGNSAAFLRDSIARLDVAKRVELLGEVSEADKWRLLTGARCLAFLSRWDGPPRPIREAIAVGTPVVVTPGTNLGGPVSESGAGEAVGFRAADVAGALLRAADDPTMDAWVEGAIRLRDRLSWSKVARSYLDGYEASLRAGRLPP
jgi:glycosyltransferase involved in cell wall biosynthesis